jgi:predicted negative regulator of RcsB-dependent stress response
VAVVRGGTAAQEAVTCYQQALDLFQRLGHRVHEAETLDKIGDVHHATGNKPAAAAAWGQAMNAFVELNSPEADAVRDKLSQYGYA